ncbi:MAG: hypothetical protein J6N21_06470, partial [Butyrivibrio sp.]|nr:hypothetical protein [Butyrivibrio sp.]
FYYTVEDSYVDSKGNWKAPTFKLYQAQQGTSTYTGADTVVLNTKKSISTKDVDIDFTLSENAPKNITGAVGTLTAVGDNYKVKTTGGGEGGKDKDAIDIDGVYLYTKKVTLPKDGITLNTYTTQTKDNVRWLKTDEKGNLVYTYNGLNVDIGASLKSLTLNSGKDNSVTIDSTNGDVKTAVGSAIEVIDLKPNTLAQTSGKYTATVRIRPDVVQKGRTADAAGEQYGGTVKITFTVKDMSTVSL